MPTAIICKTVKGKGVSFMENNAGWHGKAPNQAEYEQAMAELTDYSGTGLVNLHTREYDARLLEIFGLREIEVCLPPLCMSTDICGFVSNEAAAQCGLMPGTPVIGGMFDIDACALAVGVTDEKIYA